MKLNLIDSHCHPPATVAETTERLPDWLQRAKEEGVSECIAIGTDDDDWDLYRTIAQRFPGTIHWTAGLHPSHVDEHFSEKLLRLPRFLGSNQPVPPCALGEIGLDFTRIAKERREEEITRQEDAFSRQLLLAIEKNLPVVIHSRGTVSDCIRILKDFSFPSERAIFHCFAEGTEALKEIQNFGAKCSFTGIITFRSAENVREALKEVGLQNLILETDSPYLSPEPYRGKKNEPARIATLAQFCANFFDCTIEEVAETTRRNTREFFGLAQLEH